MFTVEEAREEVFSASEIACVAGVAARTIRARIRSGEIPSIDGFVTADAAVRAVRRARSSETPDDGAPRRQALHDRHLFAPAVGQARHPLAALGASGAAHALAFAIALVLAGLDLSRAPVEVPREQNVRLVFLAQPGPGGGGGGGGLRQPAPARRAELRGNSALNSPVTTRRSVAPPADAAARVTQSAAPLESPQIQPRAPEPHASAPQAPPVSAPVAPAAGDARDAAGTVAVDTEGVSSNGQGTGGGAGSGEGTGNGTGQGPGIGPGVGGGTGGGPYRAGSGITPPGLLHEVRPVYPEEARLRGVTGEVLLEIVVRRDGTVGDVRLLRGLGEGLDARAVEAVRQWRFTPARRLGNPVDVMVEVAVEFKLR